MVNKGKGVIQCIAPLLNRSDEMFLKNIYDDMKKDSMFDYITWDACDASTFNMRFLFWRDHLFERMIRLFVWNCEPIKQKEIEQRLILQGYCGIAPFKGEELTAFYGTLSGVTKYIDERKNYIAHCPIWTKTFTIGEDLALIDNNQLRNRSFDLIYSYAVMLAHADVSLIMSMINHRTDSGIPVAKTEKHKQSIRNLQKKVFNGEYASLTDIGDLGLEFVKVSAGNSEDLVKLYETRRNLIKDFYADIGVRSAFEKNNNTVNAEITSDQAFLLLNVMDMLNSRQEGCEEVNRIFGTSWSVDLAPEVKMIMEEGRGEENENSERTAQDSNR